jgi:hypothetical protein
MAQPQQTPIRRKRGRDRPSEKFLASEIHAVVASEADGRLLLAQNATDFLDRVLPVDQRQIENARQQLLDAMLLGVDTQPSSKHTEDMDIITVPLTLALSH